MFLAGLISIRVDVARIDAVAEILLECPIFAFSRVTSRQKDVTGRRTDDDIFSFFGGF